MALSSNEYDRLLAGIKGLDQRLAKLEDQGSATGLIMLKLDHMSGDISAVKEGVEKINSRVVVAEGHIAGHETRVTVLENNWADRTRPALEVITDNRIQIAGIIAKYGAGGLGIGGGIVGAVFMLGKGVGWW